MYICSVVTPGRRGLGCLCPLASARRVIQTSTGPVQLVMNSKVGKWPLLKKKKDHLRLTEAVRELRVSQRNCGGKNSCLDQVAQVLISSYFQLVVALHMIKACGETSCAVYLSVKLQVLAFLRRILGKII